MELKRYILIFKENGYNRWADADDLKIIQSVISICNLKEYKIIDNEVMEEVYND